MEEYLVTLSLIIVAGGILGLMYVLWRMALEITLVDFLHIIGGIIVLFLLPLPIMAILEALS